MYTTIQKWGNSQGIRIPKNLLESLNLRLNDRVEINWKNDEITIRKVAMRHRSLAERLEGFDESYEFTEWDTGAPVGNEVL